MATLPPLISYTPVLIPLNTPCNTPQRSTTLLRRDLFDARFQVLNQDEEAAEQGEGESNGKGKQKETFVDEGTDLVKGVYEGGLKTWECSLDLVDCLDSLGFGEGNEEIVRGKSVLEVSVASCLLYFDFSLITLSQLGCGTALPICSVFARLLSEIRRSPSDPSQPPPKATRFHLQDYNNQGKATVSCNIPTPHLPLTLLYSTLSSSLPHHPPQPPAHLRPTPHYPPPLLHFTRSRRRPDPTSYFHRPRGVGRLSFLPRFLRDAAQGGEHSPRLLRGRLEWDEGREGAGVRFGLDQRNDLFCPFSSLAARSSRGVVQGRDQVFGRV